MTAADRWRTELAAWAIDPEILAAAPESPYTLPPEQFRAEDRGAYDEGPSPSRDRAREVLPEGGTVLDVGCGAGAAALALAPPAGLLVGVDEQTDMLAAFVAAAAARGVPPRAVQGRWPEVAAEVEVADVVVCHHVLYNVADLAPFVQALTAHARRRVVVELTAVHPWVGIRPLWQRAHGQDRPAGPTAELAAEVLREAGVDDVQVTSALRPTHVASWEHQVAGMRRRLCLPAGREPEVARWMRELGVGAPAARETTTLWWDVGDGRSAGR